MPTIFPPISLVQVMILKGKVYKKLRITYPAFVLFYWFVTLYFCSCSFIHRVKRDSFAANIRMAHVSGLDPFRNSFYREFLLGKFCVSKVQFM